MCLNHIPPTTVVLEARNAISDERDRRIIHTATLIMSVMLMIFICVAYFEKW
jgi:hypothetical protein